MTRTDLLRSLLRYAHTDGRAAVEAIWRGQFTVASGGKVMTTATATNKSFSFTIASGMGPGDVTAAADDALAWLDSHTSNELAAYITRRATRTSVVRYGIC